MSDQWSSLLLGLAQDATLVEVKAAVEALANSGLATDAELVLVKQAVEALANSGLATDAELVLVKDAVTALANSGLATEVKQDELIAAINALANSGLATEAEQIALRDYITDKCRSLQKYEKSCGEVLLHWVDEETCNRYHLRAPEGSSYADPVWEVTVFDNTNGKTRSLTDQIYTDFAEVPEEDTVEFATLVTGPVAFYPLGDPDQSATAANLIGADGTYLGRAEGSYSTGTAVSRYGPSSKFLSSLPTGAPPIRIATGIDPSGWTGITLNVWFKTPSTVDSFWIKTSKVDMSLNGAALHGSLRFSGGSSAFYEETVPAVTDDQPHMYTLRWSQNGTLQGFLDGVLIKTGASNTGTIEAGGGQLQIGGGGDGSGYHLRHWSSGFGIWDRGLSDSEIVDLYEAGKL